MGLRVVREMGWKTRESWRKSCWDGDDLRVLYTCAKLSKNENTVFKNDLLLYINFRIFLVVSQDTPLDFTLLIFFLEGRDETESRKFFKET